RRFRSRMISFILLGFQYTMFSMFEPITVYQNYGSIASCVIFVLFHQEQIRELDSLHLPVHGLNAHLDDTEHKVLSF
ncbi:MAG: hypothetical protein IJG69_03560, partial [Spirochaetales bacterium]|nr:hypothetical protein [Spirochaetales bacterium]